MDKTTLTFAVLALAALGAQQQHRPPGAAPGQQPGTPFQRLQEERMTLEYTPMAGEMVVMLEAEAEARLDRAVIRSPGGEVVLKVTSGETSGLGMQGFVVETGEASPEETFAGFPAGTYEIVAWTVDGQPAFGSAELSHKLMPPIVVLHPTEGASVSTANLTVSWEEDADAAGYLIVVEQGENDGLVVELPPGNCSFRIPVGVLEPDMESHVEVGSIGANGNCTLVEVGFTTF